MAGYCHLSHDPCTEKKQNGISISLAAKSLFLLRTEPSEGRTIAAAVCAFYDPASRCQAIRQHQPQHLVLRIKYMSDSVSCFERGRAGEVSVKLNSTAKGGKIVGSIEFILGERRKSAAVGFPHVSLHFLVHFVVRTF